MERIPYHNQLYESLLVIITTLYFIMYPRREQLQKQLLSVNGPVKCNNSEPANRLYIRLAIIGFKLTCASKNVL